MSSKKLTRYAMTVAMAVFMAAFGAGLLVYPNLAQSGNQPATSAAMPCPKCNGPMDEGIVGNYTGGWMADEWRAVHSKMHHSSLERGSKKITTFRCTNCGYLKSYAK